MSAGWAGASSRPWRRLRQAVLERDGYRCQVPDCDQPANTVGHLDPVCEGNPVMAPSHRLRAECARHNYSDGARIGNARRPGRRQPRWTW